MRSCILVVGSLDSANFEVAFKVIKSTKRYDSIHIISTDKGVLDDKYVDSNCLRFYHQRLYSNRILRFVRKRKYAKLYLLLHIFFMLLESYGLLLDIRMITKQCEKIIKEFGVTDVFTLLNPSYAHASVIKLKYKYGLKLYQFWIDQYSNKAYHMSKYVRLFVGRYFIRRLKKEEDYLLSNADYCFALPETFIGDYIAQKYKDKISTFEIPYIEDKLILSQSDEIVFAGAFVSKVRDPEPVFELLLSALPSLSRNIQFTFYVPQPELYKDISQLSCGRVNFHSYISREKLSTKLADAYMLLTIGNKGITQMPSKTVEYISYRKPILFFYADDSDASFRYFNEYPDVCKIDVRNDKRQNTLVLADYINSYHDPIDYQDILKVPVFRESSLDFVGSFVSSLLSD